MAPRIEYSHSTIQHFVTVHPGDGTKARQVPFLDPFTVEFDVDADAADKLQATYDKVAEGVASTNEAAAQAVQSNREQRRAKAKTNGHA